MLHVLYWIFGFAITLAVCNQKNYTIDGIKFAFVDDDGSQAQRLLLNKNFETDNRMLKWDVTSPENYVPLEDEEEAGTMLRNGGNIKTSIDEDENSYHKYADALDEQDTGTIVRSGGFPNDGNDDETSSRFLSVGSEFYKQFTLTVIRMIQYQISYDEVHRLLLEGKYFNALTKINHIFVGLPGSLVYIKFYISEWMRPRYYILKPLAENLSQEDITQRIFPNSTPNEELHTSVSNLKDRYDILVTVAVKFYNKYCSEIIPVLYNKFEYFMYQLHNSTVIFAEAQKVIPDDYVLRTLLDQIFEVDLSCEIFFTNDFPVEANHLTYYLGIYSQKYRNLVKIITPQLVIALRSQFKGVLLEKAKLENLYGDITETAYNYLKMTMPMFINLGRNFFDFIIAVNKIDKLSEVLNPGIVHKLGPPLVKKSQIKDNLRWREVRTCYKDIGLISYMIFNALLSLDPTLVNEGLHFN